MLMVQQLKEVPLVIVEHYMHNVLYFTNKKCKALDSTDIKQFISKTNTVSRFIWYNIDLGLFPTS